MLSSTSSPAFCAEVRTFAVTRDTSLSTADGEDSGGNGGASRLKLKSYQELALVDADFEALRGRTIERATLLVRSRSSAPLRRVSVSTVATPWTEGDGTSHTEIRGAASFRAAQHGAKPWAGAASDLTHATFGAIGSVWSWSEASAPEDGWQRIAVDPRLVAARIAGLSEGFALIDDVGTEWTRAGERVSFDPFPNRLVSSREGGPRSAPRFEIVLGVEDHEAPAPVANLRALDDGTLGAVFDVPEDPGGSGVLGFRARVVPDPPSDLVEAFDVRRTLVPLAGPAGEPVRIALDPTELASGLRLRLRVEAIDAAGNASAPRDVVLFAPERPSAPPAAEDPPAHALRASLGLPRLGTAEVAVVDLLERFDVDRGTLVDRDASTLVANDLWSAESRTIRVALATRETHEVQVVVRDAPRDLTVRFEALESGVGARIFAGWPVPTPRGRISDPLVPWPSGRTLADAHRDSVRAPHAAVFVELTRETEPASSGPRHARLVLEGGGATLALRVVIESVAFAPPRELTFVPELNAYDLPAADELAWYRLAREHRACLNRLPYGWNGAPAPGLAPEVVDGRFEWSAYDARVGPLLDGSAFAGLAAGEVPVETLYLPINETWPEPIDRHLGARDGRAGLWADEALPAAYWSAIERAARAFAAHAHERGWTRTKLAMCLNGKVEYKRDGWGRCSALWNLDEPAHTQDFLALRQYALAFRRGVRDAASDAQMLFRADVSRPQWQRDLLDGVLGIEVVGGGFESARPRLLELARRDGTLLFRYAEAPAPGEDASVLVAWCLESFALGADGVIPWQTIGTDASWTRADPLALLYPGGPAGVDGPVASVRLKALRRGQQMVERFARACANGYPRSIESLEALAARAGGSVRLRDAAAGAASLVAPSFDPEVCERLRRSFVVTRTSFGVCALGVDATQARPPGASRNSAAFEPRTATTNVDLRYARPRFAPREPRGFPLTR